MQAKLEFNKIHLLPPFEAYMKTLNELSTFKQIDSEELLIEVPLDLIEVNQFQPRRRFSSEELHELAQSILSVGLIQPPVVRPLEGKETYELISGERRFRAAQLAGLTKINVLVKSRTTSTISAQAALIENIQRVDLNPIEIAEAFRTLIEKFGFSQENLAESMGKKRSTVANYLRLLHLPKNLQEAVKNEVISMGHAKAILSLEGTETQTLLYEIVVRDHLNVRETEKAAKRLFEKSNNKELTYVNRDIFLDYLGEKIQQKLGTKVTIEGSGKQGRITIQYHNLDDLDRLLQIFGVE